MKLAWDYNINTHILTDENFTLGKLKERVSKLNYDENQIVLLNLIFGKLQEINIIYLLKESIISFLMDELWLSTSLSNQKEILLFEKISKNIFFLFILFSS